MVFIGVYSINMDTKKILCSSEWMSKPKINYHKSEMVTFGMEEEEQDLVANMLNCKSGMMPITYLGFLLVIDTLGSKP